MLQARVLALVLTLWAQVLGGMPDLLPSLLHTLCLRH